MKVEARCLPHVVHAFGKIPVHVHQFPEYPVRARDPAVRREERRPRGQRVEEPFEYFLFAVDPEYDRSLFVFLVREAVKERYVSAPERFLPDAPDEEHTPDLGTVGDRNEKIAFDSRDTPPAGITDPVSAEKDLLDRRGPG